MPGAPWDYAVGSDRWPGISKLVAQDDEIETWLTDAVSVIHQHCGSDGSDDAHNDWVNDLANELCRIVGPARAALDARGKG